MNYPLLSVVGLEGASKTTSINTINTVFNDAGLPLLVAREPGGTPLAEDIRTLHKKEWDETVDHNTEMLMMFAARNQSYQNVVRPELSQQPVLLDRCWWCTYAYQIHDLVEDQTVFWTLTNALVEATPLSAVLFLDVSPEIGIARARGRGALDRIEKKDIGFFERAREGYKALVKKYPHAQTIDANDSEATVQARVRAWAQQQVERINNEKGVFDVG